MILVRACKGITFSKSRDAVKSIFVLYGTRDERLFHLQALASIAQTILNPKFEERWLAAPTDQGIKDVIILSERRRIKED
jgi:mannitol/fructose-specific phosphotransferase system IIA component (Ntr-type)